MWSEGWGSRADTKRDNGRGLEEGILKPHAKLIAIIQRHISDIYHVRVEAFDEARILNVIPFETGGHHPVMGLEGDPQTVNVGKLEGTRVGNKRSAYRDKGLEDWSGRNLLIQLKLQAFAVGSSDAPLSGNVPQEPPRKTPVGVVNGGRLGRGDPCFFGIDVPAEWAIG